MKRRAVLTATATGLACGLAGCDASTRDGNATTARTTTAPTTKPSTSNETTNATTTTTAPASFELVTVNARNRVEVGGNASWSFTVTNTGGEAGEFTTNASTRADANASWSTVGSWNRTLEPGETATFRGPNLTAANTTTMELRLDAFNETTPIYFFDRKLSMGEPYRTPSGVDLSVERLELETKFSYELGDHTYTQEPGRGKFVFAHVRAENHTSEAATTPAVSDFGFTASDTHYDPITFKRSDAYEGGTLEAGASASGIVAFDVPGGVAVSRAAVALADSGSGDDAVYWSESYH